MDVSAGETSASAQWLAVTCVVIFFSALAAGLAPLAFSRFAWMDKITALGAGLCLGASLGLIIPEGFEVMENFRSEGHDIPDGVGGMSLTCGMLLFLMVEHVFLPPGDHYGHSHDLSSSAPAGMRSHRASMQEMDKYNDKYSDVEESAAEAPTSPTSPISLQRGGAGEQPEANEESVLVSLPSIQSNPKKRKHYRGLSATVMMVLHAASDGLVIGVAPLSGHSEVSAVVAVAMIAHKIPASFSLGSYLVALKWRPTKVAWSMLAFALSSPVAAVVTYELNRFVPKSASALVIAILMLFSGGSVLYTGCFHMLPEALKAQPEKGGKGWKGKCREVGNIWMVALGTVGAAMFGFIADD